MAFERWRRCIDDPKRLIIVPVSYGLGNRDKVAGLVRQETGEDISGLWTCSPLEDMDALPQKEASYICNKVLRAYMAQRQIGEPVSMAVVTRGAARLHDGFVINGVRLLGGDRRKRGGEEDWKRFLTALESVVRGLEKRGAKGNVQVRLNCHLSAAFAIGRILHQASGWHPSFRSSLDELLPAGRGDRNGLSGDMERSGETGALVVVVDLLGHKASRDANRLIADMSRLGGRGSWTSGQTEELNPFKMAKWARWISGRIRDGHADTRPGEIHVFLSTPATFAAALGHHMTAMEADIVLYEHGDNGYRRSMVLEKDLA